MKVTESWLQDWVKAPIEGQDLATQLTMAGLEVDSINPVAGEFSHVIVAYVVQTTPHPQADKLSICQVETGHDAPVQIVCGAANVRAGLKVALALPGANLPGGILINETQLRGQLSQGMLCSTAELGLEEHADGILELASDAPVGTDLREYLALNDQVFDIDLTPNRADCLSVLGIAREIAALNQLPMIQHPITEVKPQIDTALPVTIKATDACPCYYGQIIRQINADAHTPLWMQERLRRCGVRPLHPVVDVANYVMLELGQPLHTFDLNCIEGELQVRYATEHEQLVLLDGQMVELTNDVLVIADKQKPLAIAGVMGGEMSAVQAHTIDIFIESAFFNPLTIAGVARRYALNSEAAQRFERGVDPMLPQRALERATGLLQSIVGGQVGPMTIVKQTAKAFEPITVQFNPKLVHRLSGLTIAEDAMADILERLGMSIDRQSAVWLVTVPSYRFDITLEVDLVEEIIRLYGYHNITATQATLSVMQAGQANPEEQLTRQLATFLVSRGYRETITYSFVDPQLQATVYPEHQTLALLNPISSELSQMRAGMWPGLLASMVYNIHRQQTAIKFFEVGVVFDVQNTQLHERSCLAGLMTGDNGHLNWNEVSRQFDFYDLKGDIQAMFALLNKSTVQFVPAAHPSLHPGKTAQILVDNQPCGWLGALHPSIADELDLTTEILLFELTLTPLLQQTMVQYQPISKYPQTRRDLSLLVDQKITAQQIEQVIQEIDTENCLKAIEIFDVYMGPSIPAGKKSLTIALTLQHDNRTLVDADINQIISAILDKLKIKYAITLRID